MITVLVFNGPTGWWLAKVSVYKNKRPSVRSNIPERRLCNYILVFVQMWDLMKGEMR